MEGGIPGSVENKITRISQLLGEAIPIRSDDKENANASNSLASTPAKPHSSEAFYNRLVSYGPGHWGPREISPLECSRYGWKLIQPDVIQCVTCKQVVCATLPHLVDREAYSQFLEKLKRQVVDGHHEACWWRHNPFSLRMTQPPQPAVMEDLQNLSNSAHTLGSLESALPHLDIPAHMAQLSVEKELLERLYSTETISDTQMTAVLLVLSGWSRGAGAYLRCRECCRSVGLWSFLTRADVAKPAGPTSPRKRKSKLSEGTGEESGAFINQEKHAEPEDTQSSWRMRLRERPVSESSTPEEQHSRKRRGSERSRKSSTTSLTDAKEESHSPLVISTSPSTEIQKVEKQFFHPLEEHRPWCPWVTEDEGMKGYQRILNSVKDVIKTSEKNSNLCTMKSDGNVRGLRLLRMLLDDSVAVQ